MSILDITWRLVKAAMRSPTVQGIARTVIRQSTIAIVRHIRQLSAHRKGMERVN